MISHVFTTVCIVMQIHLTEKHMSPEKKVLTIRDVEIYPPTVMAPMAGVTDAPFRRMIKQNQCGLVCSEMISSNALCQNSEKTVQMMHHLPCEKPISVQIFGAKPEYMAKAADMVQQTGADIIDINFGCSVKKVVKTGAGAALMKDFKAAASVIKAVRNAVSIPLTIKIRSGWEPSGDDAVALAEMAEDLGVDAICVHPRTARQGFSGHADWSVIKRVRQRVSIAVIGNGDIVDAQDALEMVDLTGCHGVMVGRAAMTNPLIFAQILALFEKGPLPEQSLAARFAAVRNYAEQMFEVYGEDHACRLMRSRLGWLLKGMDHASGFRRAATRLKSIDETRELIGAYEQQLADGFSTNDSTKSIIKSA
jgi:nifR3 family TIM-barrel protein